MRLKELRKNKGLSQKEVAEDLNYSNSCISDWETGRREPSINDLIKLSGYYKVSVDYIIENNSQDEVVNEPPNRLTENEDELLSIFALMTETDQKKALKILNILSL